MKIDIAMGKAPRMGVDGIVFAFMLACSFSASAGLKYWTTGGYDADSYVQDGLVLNYDGIRNVGIDQPHSTTTTTWVNLANPGTQNLTKSGSGKNSKWLDDGFFFDGTNCFGSTALTIASPYETETLIDANCSDHIAKKNIGYVFFTVGDNNQNWTKWSLAVRNSTTDGIWFNTHYYTSDRPKIKNTDTFSYLTMIANDTYAAIFSGLTEPTGAAGRYGLKNGTTTIGSFTSDGWGIGGSPGGGTQQLIGTIKSFRHYSRVLSLDERTWNRAVDDYRFFGKPVSTIPATNVVLVSSVASVGGNEKAGLYAVDANGYTFTAPASQTVNGRAYTCTGYTLETWDGSAWGAAVAHDGETSYAASDSGLVRLTWQWTAGDGLVTYDTGDYVQDGLLLHYDGIANAGADKPHASDTKMWNNIAPNGGWNMALNVNTTAGSQPGEWRADGYRFERESWFAPGVAFTLPSNQTIQIALDGNGLDQDAYNPSGAWVNEPYLYYANATFNKGGAISLRRDNRSTGNEWFDWPLHGYGDANTRPSPCQPNGTPLHYVTTVLADTFGAAFLGTVVPTKETNLYTTFASRRDLTSGPPTVLQASNFSVGGLSGANNRMKFRGVINNFRFYNRVLTDDELAHNRMVDDYRFHGVMPVTNVIVATSHSFFSGNERCFNYQISGSYTFSASAETRTDSHGIEYAFDGYTLETWDAATRDWSTPVAYAGSTYTWTAVTSPAKVRLTWRWKATRGLRTAADYGLEDIVPNGLVLHYDGKKNIGAESADVTNPTSAWSRAWVNLADTSVYTLSLYRKTTSAGGWTDCGFAFTNTSTTVGGSFKYDGLFTFTPHYSMQVLVDASADDQVNATCGYLMFCTPWSAASMAIRTATDYNYAMYYVANDIYAGADARPRITNASRTYSYATAIINGKTATFFEGTEAPTSGDKAHGYFSSTKTALATNVTRIAIGGNGGNGSQDFTGTLKTFRYYDRVLTTDEMLRNRNVDSVRYFGVLGVTNVFVEVGGGVQAETGAYKVEGSWTFTATTAAKKNGTLVPVVRYTVETLANGVWTDKTWYEGASYTYTEGIAPATVRLTWHGHPEGTVIMMR